MRRRPLFLFLAGVMTLSLAACGPAGADDPAGQTTLTPTATPEPAPTFAPEPASTALPEEELAHMPPGDYAPWQTAYAGFLLEVSAADYPPVEQDLEWDGEQSDSYSLYDVDKDGTPELFLRCGLAEAGYHTACYAFKGGEVAKVGDFPSGHASLYSDPEENGVLFFWGHMGVAYLDRLSMVDGELKNVGELFSQDLSSTGELEYTEPGQVVPGAVPLGEYTTHAERGRRWTPPVTLPIYDYGAYPRQADPCLEDPEVRAAIGQVLWENGELEGCSGDGYYGGTGVGALRDYLEGAYPYDDGSLTLREYAFVDANADGQTDCILRLEEEPDEYGNVSQYYAVLSVQEGTVYAYFFGFMDGVGIDPDGTVYFQQFGDWRQVSFYKDQCYDFPALREPVEGCGLAWDPFPAETP